MTAGHNMSEDIRRRRLSEQPAQVSPASTVTVGLTVAPSVDGLSSKMVPEGRLNASLERIAGLNRQNSVLAKRVAGQDQQIASLRQQLADAQDHMAPAGESETSGKESEASEKPVASVAAVETSGKKRLETSGLLPLSNGAEEASRGAASSLEPVAEAVAYPNAPQVASSIFTLGDGDVQGRIEKMAAKGAVKGAMKGGKAKKKEMKGGMGGQGGKVQQQASSLQLRHPSPLQQQQRAPLPPLQQFEVDEPHIDTESARGSDSLNHTLPSSEEPAPNSIAEPST